VLRIVEDGVTDPRTKVVGVHATSETGRTESKNQYWECVPNKIGEESKRGQNLFRSYMEMGRSDNARPLKRSDRTRFRRQDATPPRGQSWGKAAHVADKFTNELPFYPLQRIKKSDVKEYLA